MRLGLSWTDASIVVISAVGVYLAFLILIRIVGQRALAAMSSFDFAATIALAAPSSATPPRWLPGCSACPPSSRCNSSSACYAATAASTEH